MRCKSRRVGGALKAEMSGFDREEMAGRQTRKLDLFLFLFMLFTSDWSCKMVVGVCLCMWGWMVMCGCGWAATQGAGGWVGGCLDMDLCTKQFHKQALAAAR